MYLGLTDLFVRGNQAYVATHNILRDVAYRHHCLHKGDKNRSSSAQPYLCSGMMGTKTAVIRLCTEGTKFPHGLQMLTTRISAALKTVRPGSIILAGTYGGLLPIASSDRAGL